MSSTPRIYLSPPHMSPRERELLIDAFDSNWIAPLGPHVDAFEAEMAAFVGIPYAVALSSGTAALHLALLIEGVQRGDVVLCQSFTFAATANAVAYVGAEPVFIDSDDTWCLDPDLVDEAIRAERAAGRRVGAVIAVDLYGLMPDYERLEAVCRSHGVPLVEDAAEALGSRRKGAGAGCFGASAILSFNGNKIITTSGGGMYLSTSEEKALRARYLATQARQPVAHYEHTDIGYNYRLSNLLAAVGRGQLENLPNRLESRAENRRHYEELLPTVQFMPTPDGVVNNHWLTAVVLETEPEQVRQALETQNIETRALWKPMHLQPVFEGCRFYGSGVCDALYARGLCLPSGSALTSDDRERIAHHLVETL